MIELFNYDTSWLSPALKFINIGIYILFVYGCFRARRYYVGDLYKGFTILAGMGIIAALAALFRYFGDGIEFGFTKEFSLKWLQSLGYVIQAVLFVIAARWFAKGLIPEIRE